MAIDESNKTGPVVWVLDGDDAKNLAAALRGASECVFDLETTGLVERAVTGGHWNGGVAARITLASYTLPQAAPGTGGPRGERRWDGAEPTTYVVPLHHPESPWVGKWRTLYRSVTALVAAERLPVVGHNVKYDARWTYAHTGIDLTPLIAWDTMVSSKLEDTRHSAKLKERVPERFGIPRWDDHDLTYPGAAEDVPLIELGEYAARDTYWTWRLERLHREEMFALGPDDDGTPPLDSDEVRNARLGTIAQYVAMPTVASLTAIEQRGFLLDQDWVRDKLDAQEETATATLAALAARYDMPADGASMAPTSKWFSELTSRATSADDLVVASLTPSGKPQWSKSVLTRQAREGSEAARIILEHRAATKSAEYLRSWLDAVTPDGRVHANYRPAGAATGRISCADPNMQQVTKSLKPAFLPSPGKVLVVMDYSQLELRLAAFISRSEPMIEAYREGKDLHRMLAQKITGKLRLEDVTTAERKSAKAVNFGLLYGMGPNGLREYAETAYGVVMSAEEAQESYQAFFDLWDGMKQWHQKAIARLRERGFVTSPIGRVRELPEVWDGNDALASSAERQALNTPIQGFGSDLMQMAAASIQGLLPGSSPVRGAAPVATVHDDLAVEAPADDWERVLEECSARMIDQDANLRRFGVKMDVPLDVGASVGTRWGLSDILSDD